MIIKPYHILLADIVSEITGLLPDLMYMTMKLCHILMATISPMGKVVFSV